MPRDGVFSLAFLRKSAPPAGRVRVWFHAIHQADVAESKFFKRRELEAADRTRRVGQRARPEIADAVVERVRHLARAAAIQHDQKKASIHCLQCTALPSAVENQLRLDAMLGEVASVRGFVDIWLDFVAKLQALSTSNDRCQIDIPGSDEIARRPAGAVELPGAALRTAGIKVDIGLPEVVLPGSPMDVKLAPERGETRRRCWSSVPFHAP